jgi:predicted Zn-dependent peptidase
VPVGSRNETPRYAGASHFLEHLLFKGTEKRNAFDISSSIDAVGGELNAFTTKEYLLLPECSTVTPLAVEVLMDMMTSSSAPLPTWTPSGRSWSKRSQCDDDPADARTNFLRPGVRRYRVGGAIIGTEASSGMPRADVWRHYRRWYRPANLAVVAAGGVDHKVVTRAVRKALAKVPAGKPGAARPTDKARKRRDEIASCQVRPREIEQANVVLGMSGLVRNDPRRWALGVLNAVLGGGMSSRLFQEVREKRGLALVQSFRTAHADAGAFAIYGSMPTKVDDAIDVIASVLEDLARAG